MSGLPRWGERDTLRLIALYKKYRFLWDYESKLYKVPSARNRAFNAIVMALGIPGLTTADVRSKIKNLRTSYYQEKRKIAIAKSNNKVVKSLRWFNAFKSVMDGIYNRKVGDSHSGESEVSEEESESVVPTEPNLQSEESILEVMPSNDSDTYIVTIKQEFLDEMDNLGDKSLTPTICDYLEPVVPKRSTKCGASNSAEEYPRNIEPPRKTKKIHRFRDLEPEQSRTHKKVDEFQMFANNIAHQLRKLPLNRALNLQVEVQTLIAKARIELLSKQIENENTQDEESS